MVAELFSEDSKIDDFDLYYFTLGAEIKSAGIFSLLILDGTLYWISLRLNRQEYHRQRPLPCGHASSHGQVYSGDPEDNLNERL